MGVVMIYCFPLVLRLFLFVFVSSTFFVKFFRFIKNYY